MGGGAGPNRTYGGAKIFGRLCVDVPCVSVFGQPEGYEVDRLRLWSPSEVERQFLV
jgi:hypothetical protein